MRKRMINVEEVHFMISWMSLTQILSKGLSRMHMNVSINGYSFYVESSLLTLPEKRVRAAAFWDFVGKASKKRLLSIRIQISTRAQSGMGLDPPFRDSLRLVPLLRFCWK